MGNAAAAAPRRPRDARALRKLAGGLRRLRWPEASITRLLAAAQVRELPRGHTVYQAGSAATRVFWLLDGIARVFVPGAHDRRALVALAKPGVILGNHLAVGGRRIDTAVMLTDARVAVVDVATFRAVSAELPADVVLGMMRGTLDYLSRTFRRTVRLLTLDLRGKLALALLDLTESFGLPDADGRLLPLRLTHADLAELTGVSRARVTKVLAELEAAGAIRRRGRRLVVVPERLRALAGE